MVHLARWSALERVKSLVGMGAWFRISWHIRNTSRAILFLVGGFLPWPTTRNDES